MNRHILYAPRRLLPAAVIVFTLSACTSSPGLEDLAACRFDTAPAKKMMETYIRYAYSPHPKPVSAETIAAYFGKRERNSGFLQPDQRRTMFGAEVEGISFLAMHGQGGFSVLIKGEPKVVREGLERRSGLIFKAVKFPGTGEKALITERITFASGIPLGHLWIDTEVRAGTMILPSSKTPNRLIVSCGFRYEDGYPRTSPEISE